MSTPQDKLNEIIQDLNEFKMAEMNDFTEFMKYRKRNSFLDALNNAPEVDEPLTEEELQDVKEAEEDVKLGKILSSREVFGKNE